jgi:hypothetical protein
MSAATGLGWLDVAILEACEAAGGGAADERVKTHRVLEALYETTGVGPRTTFEPLCDLARPWRSHLLLIDFWGNVGSPDFGPAAPRYSECRLTPLAAAALAAERGRMGRLPIGVINGDTHTGGRRPPLDPRRFVQAIRAAATASDDELAAMIGLPEFPTRCGVAGDLLRFAASESVELTVRARIIEEGDALAIDQLPPDSSASEIAGMLQTRVDLAAKGRAAPIGIRDINDQSAGGVTRLVLVVTAGASVADVRREVADTWGVRRTLIARLDRPLAQLVRAYADTGRGTDDLERRLAPIVAATRTAGAAV